MQSFKHLVKMIQTGLGIVIETELGSTSQAGLDQHESEDFVNKTVLLVSCSLGDRTKPPI